MRIHVRDLRNRIGQTIDAFNGGKCVALTAIGDPPPDIVSHGARTRWLSGEQLRESLADRAADPGLKQELDELAGQTR